MDIVRTAENAGGFKTLLEAVRAAGLEDTLRTGGPFTVFAPNDEAFSKLPGNTLPSLLRDKNRLANILKYHVVEGKVTASEVQQMNEAQTIMGEKVNIKAEGGKVQVNDAKVIKPDVQADNGIIHVIDSVLQPK